MKPAATVLDEVASWAGISIQPTPRGTAGAACFLRKKPAATILFAYDGSESAEALTRLTDAVTRLVWDLIEGSPRRT
jgi:hypothetical protein